MASKVLIKMPVSFNSQIGKKSSDVIRSEPPLSCMLSDPLLRISQLEQNIRFLQEQHQTMLSSLHQEIENLRSRNRDLQFQLIFGKSGIPVVPSPDSSPEESGKPKIVLTPKDINTRSLQVEMLEREVAELKSSLADASSKNLNLTQLVELQKKQLEATKKEIVENDYVTRLEEADVYIKIIVQENEDLRKEMASLRIQLSKAGSGRYNGGQLSRRGGNGEHSQQHFPPLQSQSFWGGNSQRQRSSPEYHGRRGVQMDYDGLGQAAPSLPHLTRAYSQNSSHNRPRYYSNGNHFHRGNSVDDGEGRRKYRGRGGGSNREGSQ